MSEEMRELTEDEKTRYAIETATLAHADDVVNSIYEERERQLDKGYMAAVDDTQTSGQLIACAEMILAGFNIKLVAKGWPESRAVHVMSKYTGPDGEITRLRIAAALIVAEIERRERASGARAPRYKSGTEAVTCRST